MSPFFRIDFVILEIKKEILPTDEDKLQQLPDFPKQFFKS